MAQVNNADNSIAVLVAQAEAEAAAAEEAAKAEQEEASVENTEENESSASSEEAEEPEFDPETDTTESESSSSSSDVIVEEEALTEDTGVTEEPAEDSGSSGQGTYLGNFTLTGYCNCAQCCGTAGNATASGVMPSAGHTVAMAGVPFGTQLLINGTVYTVEDLGTPYGHVDIYFGSHAEALSFGLQSADVYQLN